MNLFQNWNTSFWTRWLVNEKLDQFCGTRESIELLKCWLCKTNLDFYSQPYFLVPHIHGLTWMLSFFLSLGSSREVWQQTFALVSSRDINHCSSQSLALVEGSSNLPLTSQWAQRPVTRHVIYLNEVWNMAWRALLFDQELWRHTTRSGLCWREHFKVTRLWVFRLEVSRKSFPRHPFLLNKSEEVPPVTWLPIFKVEKPWQWIATIYVGKKKKLGDSQENHIPVQCLFIMTETILNGAVPFTNVKNKVTILEYIYFFWKKKPSGTLSFLYILHRLNCDNKNEFSLTE